MSREPDYAALAKRYEAEGKHDLARTMREAARLSAGAGEPSPPDRAPARTDRDRHAAEVPRGGWDDERKAKLLRLHADGMTYSQMAKVMGTTRSAVAGVLKRSGAERSAKVNARNRAAPAKAAAEKRRQARAEAGDPVKAPTPERRSLPRVKAPAIPTPAPLKLRNPARVDEAVGELSANTCRWPIGDPGQEGFRFCLAPVMVAGKPYCAGHSAQATSETEKWLKRNRSAIEGNERTER